MHVARAKREKTRASKSGLVSVLLLIGLESGAKFLGPLPPHICTCICTRIPPTFLGSSSSI